ncbi:hypothetical protein EJB05_52177, partial [Eragrostis curvula]
MDWYAWLCKTGLDPDVALEYALLFARNELGAADVRHLDHEVLASMGVAVAKHRLEILKLARRETSSSGKAVAAAITALPRRATRLLAAAVHRSARSVLGRLRSSTASRGRDRDREAVVVAAPRLPQPPMPMMMRHRGGGRVAHWTKVAASSPLATRGGKLPLPLPMLTHVSNKPPMLTNSGSSKRRNSTATAPAPAAAIVRCLAAPEVCSCDEEDEDDDTDDGEDVEWESMFQDLKPT